MAFFVFPQAWITAALAAAVTSFGPVHGADHIHIKYRNLPGDLISDNRKPDLILIDKRPQREWPREKAECTIVHQYGHLAGRGHSQNPESIMYPQLRTEPCHRWLLRHGIR